jgi:methyl-accepting chemotaxis protein
MRHSGWLRVFRRRATVEDSESMARSETLRRLIADLELLNRNTERDFLSIGGKLSEFIEAVDLISSDLKGLAEMMTDEQGLHTSRAMTCVLDRFTKIKTRSEEGGGLLAGMLHQAGQAKQTLSAFQGTVTILTTLGVLTQIETARLGASGADFGPLADDVKSVSGSVQERVEDAWQTASQLIPPIEAALNSAAALAQKQANDLPSMISAVLAQLASFGDIQKQAHDSSLRMRTQYEEISDAFKKLIVSLQFHDITRQQVEHVIEILRRVFSDCERQDGSAAGAPRGMATVLALQSSQLADAGDKFAASVASIAGSLEEIAEHIGEMAEESRVLSGFSETEHGSRFTQMEEACSAILAKLILCANAEAANEVTHRGLAETIGQVRGAIEKIQAVEIQMVRLALNAGVRAAHIGGSGDALAVLAGTMQQLASECGDRAESLMRSLDSMGQTSATLSVRCTSAKSSHCQATMRTAVAEFHSSIEGSFARIGQFLGRTTRLREDLGAAREGLSVGPVFAQAIARARATLDKIASQKQPEFLPLNHQSREPGLEDFAQHYTMQAERDVHAGATKTVAGQSLAAAHVPPSEFVPTVVEEVADSVEFF